MLITAPLTLEFQRCNLRHLGQPPTLKNIKNRLLKILLTGREKNMRLDRTDTICMFFLDSRRVVSNAQ